MARDEHGTHRAFEQIDGSPRNLEITYGLMAVARSDSAGKTQ